MEEKIQFSTSFFLFLFFFSHSVSFVHHVIELNATWSTLNSIFPFNLFSFRKKKSKKIGNKLVRVRHVHFYSVLAATWQSLNTLMILSLLRLNYYRINTILASWRYNFLLASYTQKNSNNNQFIFFFHFHLISSIAITVRHYSMIFTLITVFSSKEKKKKKSCDEICPFFFIFSIFLPFYFLNILCILFTHATEHHSEVDERKILPVRLVRPKWIHGSRSRKETCANVKGTGALWTMVLPRLTIAPDIYKRKKNYFFVTI